MFCFVNALFLRFINNKKFEQIRKNGPQYLMLSLTKKIFTAKHDWVIEAKKRFLLARNKNHASVVLELKK